MSCRVGITTNPEGKVVELQSVHPTLRNFGIIAMVDTKSEALAVEKRQAEFRGCEPSSGMDGSGKEGVEYATWCVYRFEYDGG